LSFKCRDAGNRDVSSELMVWSIGTFVVARADWLMKTPVKIFFMQFSEAPKVLQQWLRDGFR